MSAIGKLLENLDFDLIVAGPAFMSGRYGISCAEVCNYVHNQYHVPAVTCMFEENPEREMYSTSVYIMAGHNNGTGMRKDLPKTAALSDKILKGEEILCAEAEGYFPHGFRWQILLPEEKISAKRTVDMLKKKLLFCRCP